VSSLAFERSNLREFKLTLLSEELQESSTQPENKILNRPEPSKIEFAFKPSNKADELNYSILLSSGKRGYSFESDNFVVYLHGINELQGLKKGLHDFLYNKQIEYYRFEPLEPCFELLFHKDKLSTQSKPTSAGVKAYCWVDSGNAEFDFYTWDAMGLRLYTSTQQLETFYNQLKNALDE
jgi:hypothetical protein